jgi:hypothetical protein
MMRLFRVTRDWNWRDNFKRQKKNYGLTCRNVHKFLIFFLVVNSVVLSSVVKIGMRAATFCTESEKSEKASN